MSFSFRVITPTGVFYEGEVNAVTLPLSDGPIQFLTHHQEELTLVADGKASMTDTDGDKVDFCTSGGVFYFADNAATRTAEHVAYQKDWDDRLQARADYLRGEQERRKQSIREHMLSTVALNKAFQAMHHPTRKDGE